jgi:hypothetical protein
LKEASISAFRTSGCIEVSGSIVFISSAQRVSTHYEEDAKNIRRLQLQEKAKGYLRSEG